MADRCRQANSCATEPRGLQLTKAKRKMVARGDFCIVECAVREDGVASPAWAFLSQLQEGTWVEDPDYGGMPDDAQITAYDKLLTWFQTLADDGVPPNEYAINNLNDGIWEYKVGARRLSFFDTPGDGTYVPKYRIHEKSNACVNDDQFWWFPELDPNVRLGHAFPKTGQRTRPSDIRRALRLRLEDLAHDRLEQR
jgi:hypothetical protein